MSFHLFLTKFADVFYAKNICKKIKPSAQTTNTEMQTYIFTCNFQFIVSANSSTLSSQIFNNQLYG